METGEMTRAEARAFDEHAIHKWKTPGVVLMENAARGAVEVLLSLGVGGPVAICCGKGNNGGDGLAMARLLVVAGVLPRILFFSADGDEAGDARIQFEIVSQLGLGPIRVKPDQVDESTLSAELSTCEWIVDALYGTGLNGAIRPPMDRIVRAINRCRRAGAKVLAVDIPSGLDADTGKPLGEAVHADVTVTFIASKRGFSSHVAREFLGNVRVVSIGVPLNPAKGGRGSLSSD